jgi:hypothetical protein
MKFPKSLRRLLRGETRTESYYAYLPLSNNTTSIRLIILQPGDMAKPLCCDIFHVLLDNNPKYEDLSYTWDIDTQLALPVLSSYLIKISNRFFHVAPNLYFALRRLRASDQPRTLWIDALCVNQEDNNEKGQQVQIMSKIYAKAERVVIWLGEGEASDSHAFAMMERFYQAFPFTDAHNESKFPRLKRHHMVSGEFGMETLAAVLRRFKNADLVHDKLGWKALGILLLRRWFTRVWVLQEVVMGREAVVLCGSHTIPWLRFAYVVCTIVDLGIGQEVHNAGRGGRGAMSVFLINKIINLQEVLRSGQKYGLLDAIGLTRTLESTDPRDKIYGVLAFVREEDWLVPDYQISANELLRRVNVFLMAHINKATVGMLSLFDARSVQNHCKLTPWGPNWFDVELDREAFLSFGTEIEYGTSCQPSGRVSADGRLLTLRGVVFDEVTNYSNTYERFSVSRIDNDYYPKENAVRAIKYLESCRKVVDEASSSLRPEQSTLDAYWRTLVCNLGHGPIARKPHGRTVHEFQAFQRLANAFVEAPEGSDMPQEVLDDSLRGANFEAMSLGRCAAGRRFCSTKNGHLGMIPVMARNGDLVCLFIGGLTPFVIRPKTDGIYQLIGECYIHCMMNGEILELSNFDERLKDIVLG